MEITSFYFLCFFGVVLLLYYMLPVLAGAGKDDENSKNRGAFCQWMVLLAASLLFYLLNGPFYLILYPIAAVLVTAFFTGRMVREEGQTKRKQALLINLLFLFGLLVLMKYLRFGDTGQMIVPIGMSFYTFTLAGYAIDLYNGIGKRQKNAFALMTFGMFFPLMVSGPILKYREQGDAFFSFHGLSYRNLTHGAQRMLYGFFKKLVIAERCALVANTVFDHHAQYAGGYILLGALMFTLQLYTDFSGCMDIVLGLSEMLGLTLPENFKTPFFSKSIPEYWRRWHITLGVFMREYVFYPLLRTDLFTRLQKSLRARFGKKAGKDLTTYAAMFILWLTVGLWHGGALKYVIGSGLLHWLYIVIGMATLPFWKKVLPALHIPMEGKAADLFRILRTFLLVNIGNVFFRAGSAKAGAGMLIQSLRKTSMIPYADAAGVTNTGSLLSFGLDAVEWGVLLMSLVILLTVSLLQEKGSVRERIDTMRLPVRWMLYFGFLFYVILFGNYGPGYDAAAFIYQNF